MSIITQTELKSLLNYNPETGVFTWISGRYNGREAGHTQYPSGYVVIGINYATYYAHRLAWFYTYGNWPIKDLDHKNRIRADNRIDNLREVDDSEQGANRIHRNKWQMKGIDEYFPNRWRARIRFRGKQITIGIFDTKEAAFDAYKAKAIEMQGEFAPSYLIQNDIVNT